MVRTDIKVVYQDSGCALTIWRNMMVAFFREPANEARMRAFRATQKELSKHADPVGCVIVSSLHHRAKPELSEDTRRSVIEAIRAYEDRDLTVSIVLEVTGFVATTMRALLSGLILLARPKYPMKIFITHEEMARWQIDKMRKRDAMEERELIDVVRYTGTLVAIPD